MNLWEIICKIAEVDGFNLKFNLANKDIKYKKKFIVQQGKIMLDSVKDCNENEYRIQKDKIIDETGDVYSIVQELYNAYIVSRPNKNNRKSVFRAKKADELSYEQLVSGKDREEARCELEGFIVLNAMAQKWSWAHSDHWFWKGNNGLVIYKEWI